MAEKGSIAPGAALFWMGAGNVASAYAWDVPMPVQPMKTAASVAFRAPRAEWARGVLRAGLPQLPLTTLNSVISVTALSEKLFPDKRKDEAPTRKSVATSVGLMNVCCCWFGGAPACHGAGGLAGQYKFGARGGASIWVLGWLKMAAALLASTGVLDGAETPCLAAAAATVAFSNTGLGAAVGIATALAERLAERTEDASPSASSSKDDGAESKSAPEEDA
ncbi:xanthine uracil vitamin C permease [Aureococcus anophagefferens]|nr:xanthine uracil vitamin C permease [Aureococcus anophagefferens]